MLQFYLKRFDPEMGPNRPVQNFWPPLYLHIVKYFLPSSVFTFWHSRASRGSMNAAQYVDLLERGLLEPWTTTTSTEHGSGTQGVGDMEEHVNGSR